MIGLLSKVSSENDEGIRSEDYFRRAAFDWARYTKRLVEASAGLGANSKVAHAALVDIEHARTMLDKLFMPSAMKTPAGLDGETNKLTAEEVRQSVSDLSMRILTTPTVVPAAEVRKTPFNSSVGSKARQVTDLSAPVYPKGDKMLWAGVDCPSCPSKATERCRREDGVFMEKPHVQRTKVVAGES